MPERRFLSPQDRPEKVEPGYRLTGEFRRPERGEFYVGYSDTLTYERQGYAGVMQRSDGLYSFFDVSQGDRRWIVRKVQPINQPKPRH